MTCITKFVSDLELAGCLGQAVARRWWYFAVARRWWDFAAARRWWGFIVARK